MRSKEKREPESIIREIKRKTRRKFTSEEKIRIVLEGLQGESSIALGILLYEVIQAVPDETHLLSIICYKSHYLAPRIYFVHIVYSIELLMLRYFLCHSSETATAWKAGIQKSKVHRGFWIPDQQTSGMTAVDTPLLAAG